MSGPDADVNRAGWEVIGAHFGRSRPTCEVPDTFDWAMYGTGPGMEVLGNLTGTRVLDLGCGGGRHAAHVATHSRAETVAVDYAAAQIERAERYFGHLDNLHFHQADAVEFLQSTEPFDVVYSVLGLMYIDPHELLPALATAVKPDGRLVVSVLHTSAAGQGPSKAVEPRTEHASLPGKNPVPLHMWVLDEDTWAQLFATHGFTAESISSIRPGDGDSSSVECRLIQACRAK